jgi:hypothetical protein
MEDMSREGSAIAQKQGVERVLGMEFRLPLPGTAGSDRAGGKKGRRWQ